MDFPGGSEVKNPPDKQERQIQSLSQEDLRRRKWQPIPVFLPWKCHGQRSLAGYSSWDHQRVGHNVGTKQQQQYMLYSYYIKFELEISDLVLNGAFQSNPFPWRINNLDLSSFSCSINKPIY